MDMYKSKKFLISFVALLFISLLVGSISNAADLTINDNGYPEVTISGTNYYDYAKDLCMNYLVDLRKYKFSKGNSYFTALSKKEMEIVYEDLKFIKSCFQTVLRDYAEFFNERFIKRLSIRKYAEAHNMNRGSVENIQRKMYKKLSVLLYERDQADGKVRIKTTE